MASDLPSATDRAIHETLLTLRAALRRGEQGAPSSWRALLGQVKGIVPPRAPDPEELVQLTMLRVMRALPGLEAEAPRATAAWLRTIVRNLVLDAGRRQQRARARLVSLSDGVDEAALATDGLHDEPTVAPASAGGAGVAASPTAVLEDALRDRIGVFIDATVDRPEKRLGDRLRADAAIARVMRGASEAEIRAVLGEAAPASKDGIYKWVERGRDVVLNALAHWEAELTPGAELAQPLAAYRELFAARRADKGRARPTRRRQSDARADVPSTNASARARGRSIHGPA